MLRTLLLFHCILILFLTDQVCCAQTFSSGAINKSIPDVGTVYESMGVSGLNSSINGSFGFQSLQVEIDHASVKDLDIILMSPDGNRIQVIWRNGGTEANINARFVMHAGRHVLVSQAPFIGDYRPIGDFGSLNNGQNPNRTWALMVIDHSQNGITGTLKQWSITFGNSPAPPLDFNSNLPIVVIHTRGKSIKNDPPIIADMKIINNSNGQNHYNFSASGFEFEGPIDLQYRGNSSQNFIKKNMRFRTLGSSEHIDDRRNVSLAGLPRENHWVLTACYTDKSLMRDYLTYALWEQMGYYSSRSVHVELVVNGQYQGVYLLGERLKIDKNRLDIEKMTEHDNQGEALTGGYMFRIDRMDVGRLGWESKYPSNTKGDKVNFLYYRPQADIITQQQQDYLKAYVDSFETALNGPDFKDPEKGYKQFIDLNSFVDNFIINELSRDVDGYRLSSYFYKDRNGPIVNGPLWDYDLAWYNASFGGGDRVSGWQYDLNYNWTSSNPDPHPVPFWWRKLRQDPEFEERLFCRYSKFRETILDTANLFRFIDFTVAHIKKAAERNFEQWPVLGHRVWTEPGPVPTTYEGEIRRIKDWIVQRAEWMDKQIQGPGDCEDEEEEKVLAVRPDKNRSDLALNYYPNPFNDQFNLNFHLVNTSDVKVEIINQQGQRVMFVDEGPLHSGEHTTRINTSELSTGFYFMRMTAGNNIEVKKIIKAR